MRAMSAALIAATVAIAGAPAALGQMETMEPEAAPAGQQPKLTLSVTSIDFGEIDDSEEVSQTVTITNEGDAALNITSVQPTCGCTASNLEKNILEPGESTELELRFNPKRRSGDQKGKHVDIRSNDPEGSHRVSLTAWVIPRVVAEPSVASFGRVQQGDDGVIEIRVQGMASEFRVLEAVIDREDSFEARVIEHTTVEREHPRSGEAIEVGEALVEIRLKPNARIGRVDGNLVLKTNDESTDEYMMRVTAGVSGDIAVAPGRLALGALVPGQEFSESFRVFSHRGTDFEVKKAMLVTSTLAKEDRDQIAVTFEKLPEDAEEQGYTITVSGTASETMRVIQGNVVILTDAPGQKVVRAPITGVVRVQAAQR